MMHALPYADRAAKVADNEPSAEGVDSAETSSRRRMVESIEKRRVGTAGGDREKVCLAGQSSRVVTAQSPL